MRALRFSPFARAYTRSPAPATRPPSASTLGQPFSHTAHRRAPWRELSRGNKRPRLEELARAKPLISSDGVSRLVRSPSLHTVVLLSVGGAVMFYVSNLETVPVSGRRRFNCFSDAQAEAASDAQVKRIEWEVERQGGRFLDERDWRMRMVKKVMARLIPVSGMTDSEWEVRVIDDPHTANAFVLPGGKVFVFSGLIPIARSEDGLAAVLGHEIAHNLAGHVAERMSSQIGINVLLYSLIFLTGGIAILGTSVISGTVLDLLFSRPMGRRQESEADYIGLMMMAEACYDPREALSFWKRMERMHTQEPPEWMSTHPSNNNRIQKLYEWMPKAVEKLQESDCRGAAGFASLFRQALCNKATMERRYDI